MTVENLVQDIKDIKLDDLILWSENPREPFGDGSSNNAIIEMALIDKNNKWKLQKLHHEMGGYYDKSELPIVIEDEKKSGKYIVYDGNRRIILIKYLQNKSAFTDLNFSNDLKNIEAPTYIANLKEIPCNVCNTETAISSVERKHIDSGTWGALEREYFLAQHKKNKTGDGSEEKISNFLQFEEETNLISQNKKLNQRFVKEEVLTDGNLKSIGLEFRDDGLHSIYDNDSDTKIVIAEIAKAINEGEISTRKRRVNGKETLADRLVEINPDLKDKIKPIEEKQGSEENKKKLKKATDVKIGRITPVSKEPKIRMFPSPLNLKGKCIVNNLYGDILEIDKLKHQGKCSTDFPRILRFSLRLLVESAAQTCNLGDGKFDAYIEECFADARSKILDEDEPSLSYNDIKTHEDLNKLLRAGGHYNEENNSKESGKMIEATHIGAHPYSDSASYGKAHAMSIIVGAMLQISHGEDKP